MSSVRLRGRVVHPPTPSGERSPCYPATVRIYDADSGSEKADLILETTTSPSGDFDAWSSEWRDGLIPALDFLRLRIEVSQGTHRMPRRSFDLAPDGAPGPRVEVSWSAESISLPSTATSAEEADAAALDANLAANRALYQWDRTSMPPLRLCRGFPHAKVPPPPESPRKDYVEGRGPVLLRIGANEALVSALQRELDPFNRLDDFTKLFPVLGAPALLSELEAGLVSDASFGEQRLSGVNPLMLTKANSLPSDFPVTEAHFPALPGGPSSLSAAFAQGRLFLADFEILDGIPNGHGRYLPVPYALFMVVDPPGAARQQLEPIAIQIERGQHATLNPVRTRGSGVHWTIAKLAVQCADLNVHEMQSHLWETHLAMEPFAVATARQLELRHPLSALLRRHFTAMLLQNFAARGLLINPGGIVDRLLGGTLEGTLGIVKRAREAWSFDRVTLRKRLEARGVLSNSVLTTYPYRDDALLVWDAIEAYVGRYVNRYYASDASVQRDVELQAWLRELRREDGGDGDVVGLPSLNDRAALESVLTQVIFTCSAQHSAVNYPQYEYFGYVPNMPAALYANPLPRPRGSGETDLMRILPDADPARSQVKFGATLALFQYDRLGHYPQAFHDAWAEGNARQFRVDLAGIENTITQRNRNGSRRPYRWLKPSKISNSINV